MKSKHIDNKEKVYEIKTTLTGILQLINQTSKHLNSLYSKFINEEIKDNVRFSL